MGSDMRARDGGVGCEKHGLPECRTVFKETVLIVTIRGSRREYGKDSETEKSAGGRKRGSCQPRRGRSGISAYRSAMAVSHAESLIAAKGGGVGKDEKRGDCPRPQVMRLAARTLSRPWEGVS